MILSSILMILSIRIVERPGTAERAKARLAARGLGATIDVIAYSGQHALDRPADRCVLVRVLNNLGDEQAVELLQFVRRSLAPDGTVDVIEAQDDGRSVGALTDMLNLARTGGAVRDTDAWRRLAEDAGLRLVNVAPVAAPYACFRFAEAAEPGAATQGESGPAERDEQEMLVTRGGGS